MPTIPAFPTALGKRMDHVARYSMAVGSIGQDEIDLLECLVRIDQKETLDPRAADLCARLLEAGLAERTAQGLELTPAGIERCQSLLHRVASDREAAKVVAARGIRLAIAGA